MKPSRKRTRSKQLPTPQIQESCTITSPFQVLPEELWRIILLDRVKEHLTLRSTFTAIPELSTVFCKHLKKLEFNQVSPHSFEYQPTLEFPEFSTELVNKNWCDAVHQFLRTERNSQVFQHFLLPKQNDILAPCQNLYTKEEVLDFHQTLKRESNLATKYTDLNLIMKWEDDDPLVYLSACVDLLSEFGNAFKKATFELNFKSLSNTNERQEFFTGILKCLENLSNLRSLSIGLVGSASTLEEIVSRCNRFPKLSHLEQLEILSPHKAQRILLEYFLNGGYIGKGGVKSLLLKYHEDNRGSLASNVECVLKYKLDTKLEFPETVKQFSKFLATQKIQSGIVKPIHICRIPRLFKWLDKAGELEELTMVNESGSILYPVGEPLAVLPKVKYLKTTDSSLMGFQFLPALPALEYLHVELRPETKTWFLKGEMETKAFKDEPLSRLIRNYLYVEQIPRKCNIWETFPSLKMLLVEGEGNVFKHFVRENGNKCVVFQNTIEVVDLE